MHIRIVSARLKAICQPQERVGVSLLSAGKANKKGRMQVIVHQKQGIGVGQSTSRPCRREKGQAPSCFLVLLGPYSEFSSPGAHKLLGPDPVHLFPYLLLYLRDLLLGIDSLLVREFQH